MNKRVTTYFLQMTSAAELNSVATVQDFEVRRCEHAVPEFNQFMFRAVGGPWRWYSRLSWDYLQWQKHLSQPQVSTYLALYQGSLAGYFELFWHQDESVELHFFGLLPTFYGKGLGSRLLYEAVSAAWAMAPKRVWVHTCSEDHQHALANYQRRGFTLYDQQSEWETLPDDQSEEWLTAPFVYGQLAQGRG
jgi:ribosomal protein S18 acetylase RimI-like enzyme